MPEPPDPNPGETVKAEVSTSRVANLAVAPSIVVSLSTREPDGEGAGPAEMNAERRPRCRSVGDSDRGREAVSVTSSGSIDVLILSTLPDCYTVTRPFSRRPVSGLPTGDIIARMRCFRHLRRPRSVVFLDASWVLCVRLTSQYSLLF
eukprot:m.89327 g.89327  ORF g.89327 m.89327 type:complete len:148 (-) comp11738_c0_seq1:8091-8534(-)